MCALAPENLAGRRVVIFGAGYVGAEVARQAGALGARVTALTRNEAKAAALAAEIPGADVIVGELAGDAWHGRVGGEVDFVLNCVSSGGGGVEGYRRSYVDGMRSVLAWATRTGFAGPLVYTSSTSVYPQDGGVRVDESASTDGAGETARVLLEAERLLLDWAVGATAAGETRGGRRAFVLRLAGIYGPGRHYLLDQLRDGGGEVAGRGDFHLNLAHRDDIARAVWAAWGAPAEIAGGVFNIADDGAAPKAELVAWLAEKLGVPTPRFTGAPAGGRRAVTPDRVIANDRAKRELGWRPRHRDFRSGYEAILGA